MADVAVRRHSHIHGRVTCRVQGQSDARPPTLPTLQSLQALLDVGADDEAVATTRRLQREGSLRLFGTAQPVPKRPYTLEEMRMNGVNPDALLAPVDATLQGVETALQAGRGTGVVTRKRGAAVVGLVVLLASGAVDLGGAAGLALAGATLAAADQVGYGGRLWALTLDSAARRLSRSYAARVATHHAGRFLIAYLLGLLPREYSLSVWGALRKHGARHAAAGVAVCDGAFRREVASGTLTSATLDDFTRLGLAGAAAEAAVLGRAEGGRSDVQQLQDLLRTLGFTGAKADAQVRWSAVNDVVLLRQHAAAHAALTRVMQEGHSVTTCIAALEAAE